MKFDSREVVFCLVFSGGLLFSMEWLDCNFLLGRFLLFGSGEVASDAKPNTKARLLTSTVSALNLE